MPARRPVRALLLGTVALGLAGAAALAPASAAAKPPAVKGGLTQAYQATFYERPAPPAPIPSVRYYLGGTAQDDLNRVAGAPSATFGKAAPTATTDLTQNAVPGAPNGAAFWTAPYTGTIDGVVKIRWSWVTRDPLATSDNVAVSVVADPGTAGERVIGSATAGVTNSSGDVVAYDASVDVTGKVAKTLRLVAGARYADASQTLTVHYGSTSAPSYFEIPTGPAPAVKLPTTTAVKDTDPLVVAATRIGRKSSEPTLGVTPKGNVFITAADFDGLSPATPRTLIYGSYDGGRTFANVSPLTAGQPTPPTTADPYLYVDPETGRIYNDDLTVGCSFLQWSDDEGMTWSAGNPLACEAPVDDHQTLVVGNPPAGTTTSGYPNVVYYCVNKVADVGCARSLDGGRTFLTTGAPAYQGVEQPQDGDPGAGSPAVVCGGLHGHIVTDPAGRLFVPKGHCDQPWLAISEDAGQSWTQVRVNPMLVASHQTSVASDTAGNLYYTWFGAADKLPYLSVSKDHGQTWSTAVLIAPPGVAAVNFPSIDVREPGHLVISFPGTTEVKATAARPWSYYVAVTTDALSKRPTFHSTTANPVKDPIHRGACLDRCAGMYDFIDVVVAPKGNDLFAAGVDTCTGKCVDVKTPTIPAGAGATDAQGFVVRQLSGPGLGRVVALPPAEPSAPVVTGGGTTLPTTGLAVTAPVTALVALGLALLLLRRPGSDT